MWYDNRQVCEVFGWVYILILCGVFTLFMEQVIKAIKEMIGGKK